MRILFCTGNEKMDAEAWRSAVASALPEAEVEIWAPGAAPADYALVWNPPAQLFEEQAALKAVFNLGAGVDALLKMNIPAHVPITRIEDAGMGALMSEYVVQAVIRHYRYLDDDEKSMRAGGWDQLRHEPRDNFPVGVMGLGTLGQQVARALAFFGFPVNGWSRSPKDIQGVQSFAGNERFNDFLAASRVLVNVLPLTPQTENIINRNTLSSLLPDACLINVGRGAHVVEDDLLDCLDSGRLAAAVLDVYRTEPLPADHLFRKHPKITLTSHLSAFTTKEETVRQLTEKIRAAARGEHIPGTVDRGRGY
ncbi:MAG TPA: glyoxylate/hydroxypyruvate reductase A [Wenzhouxiangella sp.]|nr:glyoxylate/hydroxypyruvate reductase A [Wenzhouxiangella sp.]